MKKLSRKLFLSIAALACCTLTLISTTFAWYVNNPTSSVGTIEGSTTTVGADGSISASKNGTSWLKNINDLTTTAGAALTPVMASADCTSFTKMDGETSVTAANGGYYAFDFYVKSDVALATGTNGKHIEIAYELKNTTTGDLPIQINYSTASVGAADSGTSFSKDFLGALRIGVKQDAAAYVKYDAHACMNNTYEAPDVADNVTLVPVGTGSAHDYYDSISDTDLTAEQKTELGTVQNTSKSGLLSITTLDANTPTHLQFVVWLEGTDTDCFNACAGQSFSLDFTLTLRNNQ